ncbi:nucleotide sugar dehydrogenase [Agrobacterium sp.]|uniref:nucleotide sugar dehydrogenase n=1 Tax=Agrobacterium sp. TaxID=361 RepID=UPI0028AE6707|nr:nucleotide sugar dehydrogenase [Agrobacterium sp.]
MTLDNRTVAVIGLGYVGLPLAAAFGRVRTTIGFDINPDRIKELATGYDRTQELSESELRASQHISFTADPNQLRIATIFIVTVPTPVDEANRPDMTPLVKASETVGRVLKKNDIVVFESTVYPGATEEVCVPILEAMSGLVFNHDFFCGYSPERINPGDKVHRLENIVKVTSGSTPQIADVVDNLYKQIIVAGTHKASSIRVAEAAKVIENTQRDVNIALMNELSLIFQRLDIDTMDVLEAAGTKWNFLPFRPGLVGGHCIGVDPYYLTHKAQQIGYHPAVILAGRRINDSIGAFVAEKTVKLILQRELPLNNARVLVLGLTFKEDCPDLRNTKVVDIIHALKEYNLEVDIYDPCINVDDADREYGLKCLKALPESDDYSAVIVAVGHKQFKEMGTHELRNLLQPNGVLLDVKSIFSKESADWRL